jgi:hypothetical protein
MKRSLARLSCAVPLLLGVALPVHAETSLKAAALFAIIDHVRHDVVVVNKKLTIDADTVAKNVGTKYAGAKGDEVAMTIKDGTPRTFVETGADYPNGIKESVFAVKNTKGAIIGAVIVSSDLISR